METRLAAITPKTCSSYSMELLDSTPAHAALGHAARLLSLTEHLAPYVSGRSLSRTWWGLEAVFVHVSAAGIGQDGVVAEAVDAHLLVVPDLLHDARMTTISSRYEYTRTLSHR